MSGQASKRARLLASDQDSILKGYPDVRVQARFLAEARAIDQLGVISATAKHPLDRQAPLEAHGPPRNANGHGFHAPANLLDGCALIPTQRDRAQLHSPAKRQEGNGRRGHCQSHHCLHNQ
jgi:hypothetical protein